MRAIPIAFLGKIHLVKQRNPAEKAVSHSENTDFLIDKMSLGVLDNFLSMAQKVSERLSAAKHPQGNIHTQTHTY